MAEFLAYYLVNPPCLHGGKEAEGRKGKVKPTVELSEYQKLLQETSKYFVRGLFSRVQASGFIFFFQILPYIAPPDFNHLHEGVINALRCKKIALAELADAEADFTELVKTLGTHISDAEIKELVETHCAIEMTSGMKSRYKKAVASLAMKDFCLSRMTLS